MSNFSEYPYINFSDFNYDWILKTIKSLISEWQSYNDTWDAWQEGIETDFADLKSYVENYFENLDVETEVREQVTSTVQELLTNDYILSILNNYIEQTPRTIKGDVALNLYQVAPYQIDGGVYIGNNRIVTYFSTSASDTGLLECYDIDQKTKIWSYPIEGYHGNSLTLYNNEIYICGCFSINDTTTLIPTIVVVSLNNPSTISRVITPPVSGLYSLVYGDGKFYGITYRGTVEGEANLLTVFDTDFNVVNTLLLSEFPSLRGFATQGIQCYYNNILYGLDYSNASIYGYDATTGDKVFQAKVEEYVNNYRWIGELEFITYDCDNSDFYIGCRSFGSGRTGYRNGSIIKVGLYKDIQAKRILPIGTSIQTGISLAARINVNLSNTDLAPATSANFCSLADAVNLSKRSNLACVIVLYVDTDFEGLSFTLRDFSGEIIGANATNKIKTVNLIVDGCSKLVLQNLDFNGSNTNEVYWGTYTGSALFVNSNITLSFCTGTDGDVNVVHSNVIDNSSTNIPYVMTGTPNTLRRVITNMQYSATIDYRTLIKSRIFNNQSLSANATITTPLFGITFTGLAIRNNIVAWKIASNNVYTPLSVGFNATSDELVLSDGTNTANLSIDTSTGIITVNSITGTAMTVTLDVI